MTNPTRNNDVGSDLDPRALPRWGRAANYVRYSLMNLFILSGAVFLGFGGWFVYVGMLMSFLLIGILDEAVGDFADGEAMPPKWYLNLQLYLTLPLLVVLTAFGLNIVADHPLPIVDGLMRTLGYDTDAARASMDWHKRLGAFVTCGMYYGAAGINVAHELTHRIDSMFSQIWGRWLLAFTLDTGFSIEHVYGHHRNVGTEADPATAKRGEYIFAFIFRSTYGQVKGAYKIEKARLERRGERDMIWNNRFWRGQAMSLTYLAIFILALGWGWGLFLFFHAALIGKAYLELVNYVEHYGLVRIPGKPVEARHAWDSYRRMFSGLFYNLSLHSNHHRFATRPFWELKQTPNESPVMPWGYMVTIFAAFWPPLWHRVMTPRLADWDRRLASPEERAYLERNGLLLG